VVFLQVFLEGRDVSDRLPDPPRDGVRRGHAAQNEGVSACGKETLVLEVDAVGEVEH